MPIISNISLNLIYIGYIAIAIKTSKKNPKYMENSFESIQKTIQKSIQKTIFLVKIIYNFDETGFIIDIVNPVWLVISSDRIENKKIFQSGKK